MSESKYTPGLWTVESDEGTIVRDCDGGAVCQLKYLRGRYGLNGRRTDEEVSANARLIAAAPELLKALKKSAEGWSNAIELDIIPSRHLVSACVLRDEAFAAIAKATGGK